MDFLEREGWPSDQEYPPPPWATCGNCAWIRDLPDYTGTKDEDAYGLCVDGGECARVMRDSRMEESPCGGEGWVMT